MDNNKNKKDNKQFLKIIIQALLLFIAGTLISAFGDKIEIPFIKTLGYMAAGLSGTVFSRYWMDGKKDNIFISWKKSLLLFILAVLIAIPMTLLFEGKLW